MTKTEICNLALSLLGANTATDIDTDNTPQAQAIRRWFAPVRDEALASHPWNFASTRARLTLTWVDLVGVALTDNGSGLIRVDHTGHGYQTGNRITMKDVQGVPANGTWYVTRIDNDTFDLQDSVFSGTHTSGTGSFIKVPLFGWSFQHTLPDDCMRVVRVNGYEGNEEDSEPFTIEEDKLLTEAEIIELRYVYQHTTVADWTQDFINAFAMLLASYVAAEIVESNGKAEMLRKQFEALIAPQKRRNDARSGKQRVLQSSYDSQLAAARRGFTS